MFATGGSLLRIAVVLASLPDARTLALAQQYTVTELGIAAPVT
jgi:hypothetical protein